MNELKMFTYTYIKYAMPCIQLCIARIGQEGDRQHLLRAELKLTKLPHGATKLFIITILGVWGAQ